MSGVSNFVLGPVEPRPERFDVGGVDRRAAPDAKARRRVAIAGDVVGRAFRLEQARRSALMKSASAPSTRQADAGLRTDRRSCARWPSQLRSCDDAIERRGIGVGRADQALQAADRLRPFEREDRILDRQHRRRVDRLALEDAFAQLAALDQAEDLRQRPVGRVSFPAARPRAGQGSARHGRLRRPAPSAS